MGSAIDIAPVGTDSEAEPWMDIAPDKIIFNFAVSYSGGGLKRLYEFSKWFGSKGGATFIVHPKCANLCEEFPSNRYIEVRQSALTRLFDDCGFLRRILNGRLQPDFYYSYGIPIYRKQAKVNWFHLSNILPLALRGIPMDWPSRLKLSLLGRRIRSNLDNADIISAESEFSLDVIGRGQGRDLFLSGNGLDEELKPGADPGTLSRIELATVVGTYQYKALGDALGVYEALQEERPELRLRIIGPVKQVPLEIRRHSGVETTGQQKHADVIASLRQSKYYISTTLIENSSNASAEGVFLADEAYLSDIGPHRELLEGQPYRSINISGVDRPLLHVKRDELTSDKLKSWAQVAEEMLHEVTSRLNQLS